MSKRVETMNTSEEEYTQERSRQRSVEETSSRRKKDEREGNGLTEESTRSENWNKDKRQERNLYLQSLSHRLFYKMSHLEKSDAELSSSPPIRLARGQLPLS